MKKLILTLMCVCLLVGCKDSDKVRGERIFINGKDKMNKSLSTDVMSVDEILAQDTLVLYRYWSVEPEEAPRAGGGVACYYPPAYRDGKEEPDYVIDRVNRRITMHVNNIFGFEIDEENCWIDAPLLLVETWGNDPNEYMRPLAIVPYEARHAAGEQIRALRRAKDELTDEIMNIFQTAFEFYPISEADLVNHPDYIAAFGSSEKVPKSRINWSDSE